MKVQTSPYERAINHLSRGDKFERALADELEKRVRADMAEALAVAERVERLATAIREYRSRTFKHQQATGDFPDGNDMAEDALYWREVEQHERKLEAALKETP